MKKWHGDVDFIKGTRSGGHVIFELYFFPVFLSYNGLGTSFHEIKKTRTPISSNYLQKNFQPYLSNRLKGKARDFCSFVPLKIRKSPEYSVWKRTPQNKDRNLPSTQISFSIHQKDRAWNSAYRFRFILFLLNAKRKFTTMENLVKYVIFRIFHVISTRYKKKFL